jgi:hypothetical protein
MHNAPPVVYPVGRFSFGRIVLVSVCSLSAVALLSWQIQTRASSSMIWAAWILWILCNLSAAIWVPKQALVGGRLGWSGEGWFWQADANSAGQSQTVAVSVGFDAGRGMLLWVQPLNEQGLAQGRLHCAWFQADAMPPKWHGFRCAVYSRPKTAVLSDRVI